MASVVVTQKLYREVTGNDPGDPKQDELPANRVSWFDAIAFCNLLSKRKGLAPAYAFEGAAVTWREEADGLVCRERPRASARGGQETEPVGALRHARQRVRVVLGFVETLSL